MWSRKPLTSRVASVRTTEAWIWRLAGNWKSKSFHFSSTEAWTLDNHGSNWINVDCRSHWATIWSQLKTLSFNWGTVSETLKESYFIISKNFSFPPDGLAAWVTNWARGTNIGDFRQRSARRPHSEGNKVYFYCEQQRIAYTCKTAPITIAHLSFLLAFILALSNVRGLSLPQQLDGKGVATCCCEEDTGEGIGGGGIDVSQCWGMGMIILAWHQSIKFSWSIHHANSYLKKRDHPGNNISKPGRYWRRQLVLPKYIH